VVAVGLTSWAALAIYFDLSPPRLRFSAPALYLVAIAVALSMSRRTIVRYAICLLGFLIVLACWLSLQPSNLRPWQSNLSQTPWAEISGDRVTIHNFRNCFYRRETDFTCEWPDKTVFLSQLRGMDLFMDYWGSPWIAHPIVSFQFGDGDYVAASIEARYQIGQNYSPMRSFFRQFTLVYVLAGERDLVRLRTNYRSGEKVYLYHLVASPQWSRSLFLQYLFSANKLRDQPRWFNALNDNCTTNIFDQMEATGHLPAGSSRFSWWVLLNGRAPEMLYRGGNFAGHLPFAELKEQALINPAANALDDSPDFSRRIRLNRAGFEFLHPQDAGTVSPRP
jgi:hypothetical protein